MVFLSREITVTLYNSSTDNHIYCPSEIGYSYRSGVAQKKRKKLKKKSIAKEAIVLQ